MFITLAPIFIDVEWPESKPSCIMVAKKANNKLKCTNAFACWGRTSPGIWLNPLLLANFENYRRMLRNIQMSGNEVHDLVTSFCQKANPFYHYL